MLWRRIEGMEKEYGQKSPTLPDGTTLLKEVPLSEEHTALLKSDKAALRSEMKRSVTATLAMIATSFAMNATGYVFIFLFAFNKSFQTAFHLLLAVTLMIGSMVLNRYIRKGGERLTRRMVDITMASKVASVVLPVYARYMPGDKGVQHYTYMRLVMDHDSELGSSKEYRIRLDTSNESRYVIRELIVPKAA